MKAAPAALEKRAPAELVEVEPVEQALVVVEDAAPATFPQKGGETLPQKGGGTLPQKGGGTLPQKGGETFPQKGGGTFPQKGGGTLPQKGGGTFPQKGGGTLPQKGGGTLPQKGGGGRPQKGGAKLPPAAASDSSWRFALEMSSAKLALARFAIFAVLAVDAVLQVGHASRYGAGDFNVSHFSWLPGPGRQSYLLAQCLIACLAMLVAVGAGGRLPAVALSLAYGWCYFGSQLDSYQHHYLAWLLITLWCFVPPPPALGSPGSARGASASVRSAALRLILLQLAIMYLWAAISKLDPKWLDGTAMSMQIHGLLREMIDATVGIKIVSRLVIVSELALAVTIWRASTWRWALPLGLGLHFMIALSGLEIGVFAYLMLAIYLLILPEALLRPVLDVARARAARLVAPFAEGHRVTAAALALFALLLLFVVRPPLRNPLVIAFAAVPLILTLRWQLASAQRFTTRAALAAALALSTLVVVDRAADVAVDYYRYWGGTARRLGKPAEAEVAYRGLIDVEPRLELAHYQLGRLLLKRGALEDGVAHLRLAAQLEPTRTRALDELARALESAGRHDEAKLAAQRAMERRAAMKLEAPPAPAPAPAQRPTQPAGKPTGKPADQPAIPAVPAPDDGHRDDESNVESEDRADDRDRETTL